MASAGTLAGIDIKESKPTEDKLPAPEKKNATKRSNSFSRRKKKDGTAGGDEPALSGGGTGAEVVLSEPSCKSEMQGDPLQESLQREAEELYQAGEFDEAGEKFYFLAESYNHAGDTAREIGALQNMGACLSKMQQFDKAIQFYQHCLALADVIDNQQKQGEVLESLGWTNYQLGDNERALYWMELACKLYDSIDQQEGRVNAHYFLGKLLAEFGNWQKGIEHMEVSQGLVESDSKTYARVKGDIGFSYVQVGERERGLQMLNETLELAADLKDNVRLIAVHEYLAEAYKVTQEFDEVETHFRHVISIAHEENDSFVEGRTCMDLGGLQFHCKSAFSEAVTSYTRALELAEEIGDEVARGDCLTRIGEVHLAEGCIEEAEADLRKATDVWRTFGDEMSTQLVQRRKVYKVTMCDDIDRVQFFDDHADTYAVLVRTLLASGQPDKSIVGALLAAEEGRAATIRELLAMGPTALPDHAVEDVDVEETSPEIQHAALPLADEELMTLASRIFPDKEGAIVYYMLLDEPVSGAGMQEPNAKRSCVAWVLTSGGTMQSFKTDVSSKDGRSLDELVRDLHIKMAVTAHSQPTRGDPRPDESIQQYREHLAGVGASVPAEGEVDVDLELQALSDMLLLPLVGMLTSGAPICIVAHAELHLVPFCALPLPGGKPLGIAHALSYAPSLTALQLLLEREAAAKQFSSSSVLVVGNPEAALRLELKLPDLPYSAEEAQLVGDCVGAQPEEVLTGAAAKLSSVLEMMHKPLRAIHISAHSCAKWIALAADEQDSPLLQDSAEASSKDEAMLLNDQLHLLWLKAHPTVVLSGSRCAYGEVSEDWMLGLPRTFLITGARSVLASLWDVHDEASCRLMGAFYAALRDNPEIAQAEALRAAMEVVREDGKGKWRHPWYWASFTLTGISKGI
ncbi:hypothetical protein AB1Y20_005599 [Prymnesium parvum]|uniref:CHAT domain-containing protein n=1 Tax=Prymnesium parvum TaxID=97485 RepID=A0AB34J4N6_PRYPA